MTQLLLNFIHQNLLNGRTGAQLDPTDDLLGSGLVDSIGMMQIVAFIEEEWKIKIPPEDMTIENFMTVEAMGAYLETKTR